MKKKPEGLHSSPPRYLLSLDRELLKLKILKAIDTKYTNLEFTRLILKTDTRTPARLRYRTFPAPLLETCSPKRSVGTIMEPVPGKDGGQVRRVGSASRQLLFSSPVHLPPLPFLSEKPVATLTRQQEERQTVSTRVCTSS